MLLVRLGMKSGGWHRPRAQATSKSQTGPIQHKQSRAEAFIWLFEHGSCQAVLLLEKNMIFQTEHYTCITQYFRPEEILSFQIFHSYKSILFMS